MPERLRFYLDEQVPRAVAGGLHRRGVDVLTVGEADRAGETDEAQLAFARSDRRVIFSQDTDFLRLHAAGIQHAGIVYAPQSMSVGQIIQGLILIHEILEPADMTGHVEFL